MYGANAKALFIHVPNEIVIKPGTIPPIFKASKKNADTWRKYLTLYGFNRSLKIFPVFTAIFIYINGEKTKSLHSQPLHYPKKYQKKTKTPNAERRQKK